MTDAPAPQPKEDAPTQAELDMALTWIILNTVRLFFKVPFSEIQPYEERFLSRWRSLDAGRRQAALDFVIPAPSLEEIRQAKIREALMA